LIVINDIFISNWVEGLFLLIDKTLEVVSREHNLVGRTMHYYM